MRARALVFGLSLLLGACSGSGSEPPGATATPTPAPTSAPTATAPPVTTLAPGPAPPTTVPVTTPAPSTTGPPATTAAPPTTVPVVTVAPTTTTEPPPVYEIAAPTLYPPDPLPGSAGASGSGCSPGPGDLPDGVWFGFVRTVGPVSVEFDLACFFFGDIAWEVAAAAGDEAPNDFYIMNSNPTLRIVPVAPGTSAWTLGADFSEGLVEIPYSEWPPAGFTYLSCPGEFCPVWLCVNGGETTQLVEQYLP